jgi:pimeloyl-ACP methyl ester carboxylesterase
VAASPTVVLVHGAWHDERCWADVGCCLDGRRARWRALTLPSTLPAGASRRSPGPVGNERPQFSADVGAVLDLIGSIGDEVVLCGHGYGGMVVSEAGNHPAVSRLVLLAAFCPEPGESAADLAGGQWAPCGLGWPLLRVRDGWSEVSARWARSMFYGDLPPARAAANAARLRPSSAAIFGAPSTRPAWRTKPTVYGLCRRDRVLGFQRSRAMAYRVVRNELRRGRIRDHAVELDAGHSPFYSCPDKVADLLAPEV